MQTKINKPEPVSHTIQHKSKAANQAPLSKILQAYKERSALNTTVQREAIEEEDDLIQGKFETAQRETLPEEDEEPLQQKTENKTGLPDDLKSGIEAMSGYSMDDVRVHYNSSKPAQLQALAYTQGTDIHVGPGQEKHLPHEAWHVVQQKQGRVKPMVQMQGVQVNDDEGLERESDVMGKLYSLKTITQLKKVNRTNIKEIIQRKRPFAGLLSGKTKEHHVLVYGTETARDAQRKKEAHDLPEGYIEREDTNPPNKAMATKGYFTTDRYNNYSWREFCPDGVDRAFSIYNPNYHPRNKGEIIDDLKKWTKAHTPGDQLSEVEKYQDKLLEHPRYSPIVTYFESNNFVKEKAKKFKDEEVSEDLAKERFDLETVRACKFGLDYIKEKGGQIAFLFSVDGDTNPASSENILEKRRFPRAQGKPDRVPITTLEQRKLYRIRHNNTGINFFGHDGNAIKAPWNIKGGDFDRHGWIKYEADQRIKYEKLAEKLAINKTGKLEVLKKRVTDNLKERYSNLSPSEAIFVFNLENPD